MSFSVLLEVLAAFHLRLDDPVQCNLRSSKTHYRLQEVVHFVRHSQRLTSNNSNHNFENCYLLLHLYCSILGHWPMEPDDIKSV